VNKQRRESAPVRPGDHLSNKLAFVGEKVDSFRLQQRLEADCGFVMHPTVLYSAPAPPVDTSTQRYVLASFVAIALFSPLSWEHLLWLVAFVAVYVLLSTWKGWQR
jgi:hypothetical protein